MRRALFAPLLFLALSAFASTAHAAPTADAALGVYRTSVEGRGLSMDRQGIVFQTLEGETLVSHNADRFFNPASVVKLATSASAIEQLGPDFRYGTYFYTNGTLDPETGRLDGDLVVVGSGDPSFVTEDAFLVARALRERGVREVTGGIVVKGRLFCNYSSSAAAAGATIKAALDQSTWTSAIESAFGRYRVRGGAASFEGVIVRGPVSVAADASTAGLTPLFTHRSAPLIKVLKQQNNYSNNWMAHAVGATVGGADGVESTLESRYGFVRTNVRLETTSGLGSNAMRPVDIASMLRALVPRLSARGYAPSDLMPVAGLDPGTLEERYLSPGVTGSVVAKTGTLTGVSALAGYMYTRDKGIVVFAILDAGGSPYAFRPLQDLLVREMLEACGGPAPIGYTRPVGYADLAGALIEPATVGIPEGRRAQTVGEK